MELERLAAESEAVVRCSIDRVARIVWLTARQDLDAIRHARLELHRVDRTTLMKQLQGRAFNDQQARANASNLRALNSQAGLRGGEIEFATMMRAFDEVFLRSSVAAAAVRHVSKVSEPLGATLDLDLGEFVMESLYALVCEPTTYFRDRFVVYESGRFPGMHDPRDWKVIDAWDGT